MEAKESSEATPEAIIEQLEQLREFVSGLDEKAQEEIKARVRYYEESLSGLRRTVDEGIISPEEARKYTVLLLAIAEYRRTRDSLTGLLNKREFNRILEKEVSRAERSKTGLGLILLDSDRFREINRTLGHLAGDQILITIAQVLQEKTRPEDTAARWGGDEFGIILPGINMEGLQGFNESLNDVFEEELSATKEGINLPFSVTLTTGFDVLKERDTAESLFERVDRILFTNKKEGTKLDK